MLFASSPVVFSKIANDKKEMKSNHRKYSQKHLPFSFWSIYLTSTAFEFYIEFSL